MALTRYLVRKTTGCVFIWSEILSRRDDLEEVWANTADEAIKKDPLPDPESISLAELDNMVKADIIVFAAVRLGIELDPALTKAVLLDQVKEAIFSRPLREQQEAASMVTRSYQGSADIRSSGAAGHGGDKATIAGTHEGASTNQPGG